MNKKVKQTIFKQTKKINVKANEKQMKKQTASKKIKGKAEKNKGITQEKRR